MKKTFSCKACRNEKDEALSNADIEYLLLISANALKVSERTIQPTECFIFKRFGIIASFS